MKKTFTKLFAALALLLFMTPAMVGWGQTTKTVFLETFGSTSSNTAYSSYNSFTATASMFTDNQAVKTHYTGSGSVGKNNLSAANLSSGYTDASGLSGCYHGGTANTTATIIQIANINIANYEQLSLSFGALGASTSHKVNVSYKIDDGSETTLISNGSLTNANWTLLTANIVGTGQSLTLIFKHTPTKAWTIRMDDIKVSGVYGGAPACDAPTFSVAEGVYTSTQSVTLSTTTSGATIYYTTDGTDPSTSSSVYSSAIPVSSTTTIKAMAVKSGYDNSSIASATYAIVGHAGTQADPYTVADAREVIDAGVGMTNVYATGTVSSIVEAWSTQHNNISFNISDDGETSSDQLEAYRCTSGTGVDASEVTAGDEVVVYGTLTLYNSTYEFNSGCTLVSLTHAAGTVLDPVFTPTAGGYSGTKTVEITCATENSTIYYTTNGTNPTNASTEYSSAITVSSNTTIKAIAYVGNNHSEVVTSNYQLLTDSGTTIYTVTEALAFGTYPQNGVFVSGKVCTAPSSLISGSMLTYYISADGTETNKLQVYKGMNMDNTAFTAVDDIQVGDIVTVYGNVKIYNSTKEFDQGNYLVAFQRPINPSITIAAAELTVNADTHSNATIDVTYQDIATEAVAPTISFYESDGTTTATYSWFTTAFDNNYDITYSVPANEGAARTAYFKISATDDDGHPYTSELFAFTQSAPVVDYATLPFAWAGGASADLLVLNGVTANSLGSDYASSNAPYLIKFDGDGDYIQVKCDQQPGKVTIGVKMIGGGTTSTITVQGSADGETFTNVEALTISGSQNDILTLETTSTFASTDRYVRLLFTKGSNVGVGPITIAQVTNDPFITVADATVNDVPAAGDNGTLALTYGYLTISDMTDFDVQYYDAEGEETTTPDWLEVLVAEQDPSIGEGYVVSYVVNANNGSARTAYCKVFALGDSDYVYSNLITISQVEYVAPVEPTTYTLATSIVSGRTYIITNGSNKAMGEQNTNNRAAVDITIEGNTATVTSADVYEFTIYTDDDDTDNSLFNIYDELTNGYLYAAGGTSSNYLKTKSIIDETSQWNISIDSEGKASVVANFGSSKANDPRNTMRYNSSSTIFSCYASGQNDIYLYVKDEAPTTFEYEIAGYGNDPTVKNGWYLIASPVMESFGATSDNGFVTTNVANEETFDLYRFNPGVELPWENWKKSGEHHHFNIEHGRGYLYASQTTTTLQFTGTPHNDSKVELAYTGWNLIGNPSNIASYVAEDFYVMNSERNGFAVTTNHIVNGLGGLVINGTAGDKISFKEQPAKRSDSQVTLNIINNHDNVIDRAIVRFNSDRQLGKITLFDDDTKIYIPQNDGDYAIVSSNGQGTMPVNFKAKEMGMYTISVETEGIDLNSLHLIDRLTGEDVNLLLDNKYSFIASNSDTESRFILSFNENGINANNDTFAFQNGSDIIVNGEGELQVFDVMGRNIMNTMINSVQTVNVKSNGVYIFKLNEKTQKVIVR